MWNDNRKSKPSRTCRFPVPILIAGVTLLTSLVATSHVDRKRPGAANAAASSVASRESVLEFYLVEEVQKPKIIGDIVKKYGLDRRYPPSVIEQLRFGFLTHSTPTGKLRSRNLDLCFELF